jgi:hypothetical protein
MHVLVVHAGGGVRGAGEPVEHHVGEQVVAVHGVLGQLRRGVGPLLELLDDPGELPDRRVGERVGQRLRPGGLDLEVAVHVGQEPVAWADRLGAEIGEAELQQASAVLDRVL